MLTAIVIIFSASLLLYTLLGGADFGAGIVETFSGKREEVTISKAIAPVWEANHVWLDTGCGYIVHRLSCSVCFFIAGAAHPIDDRVARHHHAWHCIYFQAL